MNRDNVAVCNRARTRPVSIAMRSCSTSPFFGKSPSRGGIFFSPIRIARRNRVCCTSVQVPRSRTRRTARVVRTAAELAPTRLVGVRASRPARGGGYTVPILSAVRPSARARRPRSRTASSHPDRLMELHILSSHRAARRAIFASCLLNEPCHGGFDLPPPRGGPRTAVCPAATDFNHTARPSGTFSDPTPTRGDVPLAFNTFADSVSRARTRGFRPKCRRARGPARRLWFLSREAHLDAAVVRRCTSPTRGGDLDEQVRIGRSGVSGSANGTPRSRWPRYERPSFPGAALYSPSRLLGVCCAASFGASTVIGLSSAGHVELVAPSAPSTRNRPRLRPSPNVRGESGERSVRSWETPAIARRADGRIGVACQPSRFPPNRPGTRCRAFREPANRRLLLQLLCGAMAMWPRQRGRFARRRLRRADLARRRNTRPQPSTATS